MLTVDPALLLAFVYFDQLHAGYLLDKDVEDILNIIGLQLSRAQVFARFFCIVLAKTSTFLLEFFNCVLC